MSRSQLEKYGPGSGLTEQDIEQTRRFLHDTSLDELDEWGGAHTEMHYVGTLARPYTMVVDRQMADEAVVVTGEFANGITPHVLARARVVRDMVSPDASLLLQPNAAIGQWDNMNYSLSERAMLRRGLSLPLQSRLERSLEMMGGPDNLTFYGPSQGGTVALDYAASLGRPAAVATLEAPNVIERSRLEMVRDFLGCGTLLKEMIKENYGDDMAYAPSISLVGLTRYAASAIYPDASAMVNVLRSGNAQGRMESILRSGGSVVHAYATGDKVSPVDKNNEIANSLSGKERYRSLPLEGDHSITNNVALSAALARAARQLLQSTV